MKKYKISETEANRVLVKNVNNRPNALATYGEAKKDGTETKDIFDRQFELVKEKYNGFVEAVADDFRQVEEKIEGYKAEVAAEVESLYGASGSVTVPVTAWSGNSASITVSGIGDSDMILFSPLTEADKIVLNACGVFISPTVSGGAVTVTCRTVPTVAISLVYFIARGGAD